MKNLFKSILIGLLIGSQAALAGLPPPSAQGQSSSKLNAKFNLQAPNNQVTDLGGVKALIETGNANLLANGNFQASTVTSSWTTGGTGLAVTADTSNYLDLGPQSALLTFTASTTGTFSQTITPTNIAQFSGVNMQASAWVKTTATTLQVCALVGGVAANCQSVPASGTWQPVTANFIGPASGSFGIQVQTSASLTGTANVGFSYVGRATNLSQVSQAQWVGSINWAGAASCIWSRTSSQSFGNFTAVAACSTPTVLGNLAINNSNPSATPSFQIPNAGPGVYKFVATGSFVNDSATGSCAYLFSDGTSSTSPVNNGSGTTGVVDGQLSYTTGSTKTINIQGTGADASHQCSIYAPDAPRNLHVEVYFTPTQQQGGFRADSTPASWGGYHNGITAGCSTSSATYIDPAACTGITLNPIGTPRNITCSTASGSLPGISCNLARTGNHYVCADVGVTTAAGGNTAAARLVDGSGAIIDPGKTTFVASGAAGLQTIVHLCGPYNVTSLASATTFKVQLASGASAVSVAPNTSLVSGTGQISWLVVEGDAPMPAPYLTGSVTSGSTTQGFRIESATVNCITGACSTVNQSSSWFSGATWSSTGVYNLAWSSSTWSSAPTCIFTSYSCATGNCLVGVQNVPGTSGVNTVVQTQTSGTLTNGEFGLMCMGPH